MLKTVDVLAPDMFFLQVHRQLSLIMATQFEDLSDRVLRSESKGARLSHVQRFSVNMLYAGNPPRCNRV